MPKSRRIFTVAGAVGAAGLTLLAAACGSTSSTSASGASTSAPAASAPAASAPASAPASAAPTVAMLKTDQTSLGTVLTDAQGFTVYWFAKDTPTSSECSGACAAAWPPVLGMPQAASGVTLTGKLGEIMRSGGAMQATYEGHPLYLYAGDTQPGQVNGNAVDGFGALWYAIKIGSQTTTSTTGSGSSSGGSSSSSSNSSTGSSTGSSSTGSNSGGSSSNSGGSSSSSGGSGSGGSGGSGTGSGSGGSGSGGGW
jgi:predicted lipoprotein with Yx(FWY)xxD motif